MLPSACNATSNQCKTNTESIAIHRAQGDCGRSTAGHGPAGDHRSRDGRNCDRPAGTSIHSFRWPLSREGVLITVSLCVFSPPQSLLVNTTQRDESVNYSYTYEDQESKNTNFQRHRRKNQRNKWTREQTDAFYNVRISRYHSLYWSLLPLTGRCPVWCVLRAGAASVWHGLHAHPAAVPRPFTRPNSQQVQEGGEGKRSSDRPRAPQSSSHRYALLLHSSLQLFQRAHRRWSMLTRPRRASQRKTSTGCWRTGQRRSRSRRNAPASSRRMESPTSRRPHRPPNRQRAKARASSRQRSGGQPKPPLMAARRRQPMRLPWHRRRLSDPTGKLSWTGPTTKPSTGTAKPSTRPRPWRAE